VIAVNALRGREEAMALAASLARASSHPLDRAIAAACEGVPVPGASSHRNVPGEGVEATVGGRTVRMGRAKFVASLHGERVPLHEATEATPVWLGDSAGWIAMFRLGDALRPGAREALAAIASSGARVHLLSGDAAGPVAEVAARLGIGLAESEATPQRKIDYVKALQAKGARVAMVGDGVNDAPVLAQADVSIAMGGGADLAQLHADAVLLSNRLDDLSAAARIARRARSIVRQNLAWALAYNVIAIPVALAGGVTPLAAGAAMAASSLVVVGNALRARAA
jgi:Cu2+-exporting ATPase